MLILYTEHADRQDRESLFRFPTLLGEVSRRTSGLIGYPLIPELSPIFLPIYMEIFDGSFRLKAFDERFERRERLDGWMDGTLEVTIEVIRNPGGSVIKYRDISVSQLRSLGCQ